ncbi:hypothetical protein [Aquirufa antheringensis]|uniref:hypothetical protein n=1 Tax=Aquirufa antheringensis TaxID=2516559 RepID=UPI0022A8E590|nr:hypothetical protein [Aquirufa antheringensis]MCZ2489274.1 hypothetical protein [Aquirufa antheringensis]
MIFKDKISFLTYLTSNENFGPLNVQFSEQDYGSIDLSIYPVDSSKSIPENIYDKLYDIIWYHFYDTTELLGCSNNNITNSEFTIQNNDGELEMILSSFKGSHENEEYEMISQIKSLLLKTVGREYFLVLNIWGSYDDLKNAKVENYYLGQYNEGAEDTSIPDEDGALKTKVLETITSWAKNFSEESSGGEYEFEEFHLDFSIGSYRNHDTWCRFSEESKGELIDLSILEINADEINID